MRTVDSRAFSRLTASNGCFNATEQSLYLVIYIIDLAHRVDTLFKYDQHISIFLLMDDTFSIKLRYS